MKSAATKVTGQQISPFRLPDAASQYMTNEVRLGQPVAEPVNALNAAKASGESSVKFGLPGGADLVLLMNGENADPASTWSACIGKYRCPRLGESWMWCGRTSLS